MTTFKGTVESLAPGGGAPEGTVPHWVMCGLCEGMVYAGPGHHTIARECKCGATIVIPTPSRGVVRWDPKRYAQAKDVAYSAARKKALMAVAKEAADKYTSLGFSKDEIADLVAQARVEAEPAVEAAAVQAASDALTEPLVEYTTEPLSPDATKVPVHGRTISDVSDAALRRFNNAGDPNYTGSV